MTPRNDCRLVFFGRALVANHRLILDMVRREVVGRYKGSLFGNFWALFQPIFMLSVYTFVFGIIFKARWGVEVTSTTEFAMALFTGLLMFGLFAECINRAPGTILANVNFVKKVVFPLEILPMVSIGAAAVHLAIGLMVWLVFDLVFLGLPPLTILWLPVILLPLAVMTLGLSYFLASLGVYLRDISQITGMVVTALMFLSPIFYPITAVPQEFQSIMRLNPLTVIIEAARDVMMWGKAPDWQALGLVCLFSLGVLALGFAWFQKTRQGFADVT